MKYKYKESVLNISHDLEDDSKIIALAMNIKNKKDIENLHFITGQLIEHLDRVDDLHELFS